MHFFSANVFKEFPIVSIELKKVYRQKDIRFISILDRIRAGKPTVGDVSELNKHVQEGKIADNRDFTITLTSLRRIADNINDIQLDKIPYPEITYIGKIEKDYPQVDLVGYHDGYFKDDAPIVDEIAEKKPNIILVALGYSKQ